MLAQIICSGCGKYMGTTEVAAIEGIEDPISHGMCEPCAEKYYKEYLHGKNK